MVHAISHTIVDLNQQSYQRLKSALALNLRRQIFIGICDDLRLRDRLVERLEEELSGSTAGKGRYQPYPYLVTLQLRLDNPDPIAQIAQWLEQNPPPRQQHRHTPTPAFQLVGVEHLSRQDASLQWLFLSHLRGIERSMPALESTLLLWVTRPWSRMIPQAAPNFWRCRTAIFDFIGEPTPSVSQPETFPISVERVGRSPSTTSGSEAAPHSTQEIPSHSLSALDSTLDLEANLRTEPDFDRASSTESLPVDESPEAPNPVALDSDPQSFHAEELETEQVQESSGHSEWVLDESEQHQFAQDEFAQDEVVPEESSQDKSGELLEEAIQNEAVPEESGQDELGHEESSELLEEAIQEEAIQNESGQDESGELLEEAIQNEVVLEEPDQEESNELLEELGQAESSQDESDKLRTYSIQEESVLDEFAQDEPVQLQSESAPAASTPDQPALNELSQDELDQLQSDSVQEEPVPEELVSEELVESELGPDQLVPDETHDSIQDESPGDADQGESTSEAGQQREQPQREQPQEEQPQHEDHDSVDSDSHAASSKLLSDRHSTPDMPLPPSDTDIDSIEQMIFQVKADADAAASASVLLNGNGNGNTAYTHQSQRPPFIPASLTLPFLPGLGDTAPAQQDDDKLDILEAEPQILRGVPLVTRGNPAKTPAQDPGQEIQGQEIQGQDSLQPGSDNSTSQSSASQSSPHQDRFDPDSSQSSGLIKPDGVWLDEEIADAFQGNVEQEDPEAFAALQQIERLREQQAPISVVAGSYRGLGNLYRNRIEQGDVSPQNLMRAMKAYEQVLQFVRDTSPVWSEVLNDMGNLCWLLSRCAPMPEQGLPHLQQGIQAYQMALSKISPHTHPQTYPMIQNNLGAAYGDLARHQNPVENLQKSLDAYQEALRYRKSDLDPVRYASTQNNLGTTYWNLAQYRDPKPNLKQAIAAYTESLHYYQPDQDAINYAMIQNNLGTAYWNLSQHERSDRWLRLAIDSYTNALQYRTLETNPVAYAATQNNLGTAYWHLSSHYDHQVAVRLNCLEQAVTAYQQALDAVEQIQQGNTGYAQASQRPIPLNFDVLATRNNLGLVLFQLATDGDRTDLEDGSPDQNDLLDQALDHHLVALQGWQSRPDLCQTAIKCVVQTLRIIYNQQGMAGQSVALSKIPAEILPEILPQL